MRLLGEPVCTTKSARFDHGSAAHQLHRVDQYADEEHSVFSSMECILQGNYDQLVARADSADDSVMWEWEYCIDWERRWLRVHGDQSLGFAVEMSFYDWSEEAMREVEECYEKEIVKEEAARAGRRWMLSVYCGGSGTSSLYGAAGRWQASTVGAL